ncbi:hypothetical protein GN956_G25269 [Arapaima gigas]
MDAVFCFVLCLTNFTGHRDGTREPFNITADKDLLSPALLCLDSPFSHRTLWKSKLSLYGSEMVCDHQSPKPMTS